MSKGVISHLLKKKKFPEENDEAGEKKVHELQLRMLRIQQGIWHSKKRAIIAFEGFDAAGKGGAIRRLTESLDPRGVSVHAIGPPSEEDQQKHYLYRFWQRLPAPGTIAVFDRSWYGRVLVEKVEKLAPAGRLERAYEEINEFESMLVDDGVDLIKIFLVIHPDEQLKRFEDRLKDPYKMWKLTDDDIEARKNWHAYVKAADKMVKCTDTKKAAWHVVPADSKEYARNHVLKIVTKTLSYHGDWIESRAQKKQHKELKHALKSLKNIS